MNYHQRRLIRKISTIIIGLAVLAFIINYFFAEEIGLINDKAFFNIRLILLVLVFIFGILRHKYKP